MGFNFEALCSAIDVCNVGVFWGLTCVKMIGNGHYQPLPYTLKGFSTYPTKGKSSSKVPFKRGDVSSLEGN